MVKQISVFLQNSPGRLNNLLKVLADIDCNIITFNIADTGDYGITRLIVSDHDKALDALQKAGISAIETEVLAVKLEDVPGELFRVTDTLARGGVNLEYAYSAQIKRGESAIVIAKPDDNLKAHSVLEQAGIAIEEWVL